MIYFIPTPIGNREDITLRGLRLLKELKIFLCEDTRTTKDLMKLYDIDYSDKQFYSLTSFTDRGKISRYENLMDGNDIGVLSEAGSPGLSDPGKEIVRIAWEKNLQFEVLPGANALVPAVIGSGFDTSEFIYLGFLPTKKGRQTKMKNIIGSDIPVFLYESVHRANKLLIEMRELGFNGKVSLCRELTKMFEQKLCLDIQDMIDKFSSGEIKEKGEFVLGFYNYR